MTNHSFTHKALLFASALSLSALAAINLETSSKAASNSENTQPVSASYGSYVDHYQDNQKQNNQPDTNPAIAIFNNTFSKYWSAANGGTELNPALLKENLDKSIEITNNRTQSETVRSYLTDRRDLRYNLISGLGPFQTAFIKNAAAQTDFNSYPDSPLPGNSPYSSMTWASENSKLGDLVKLVDTAENSSWSSTGTPKAYFQFVRPYRKSTQVSVNPALKNVMADAKPTDFDFPSGHTTGAFETGITLAYAVPQRFQQLITRSSEVGYDRVLAGRHSPLAVMGGRVLGTAITASVLNDPANQDLIKKATTEAQSKDLAGDSDKSVKDEFSNYQQNLKDYNYRLTYGFAPIGDTNKPMVVPKGAEVLLKTRLPFLSDQQRREVLATTGLPSGYPMGDDTEGWGRLNLFEAANGYGKFNDTTTINMDAAKGGFNAKDTFLNNIGGTGSLVKTGTGSLSLAGANSYSGGTTVKDGTLQAANRQALGTGSVRLSGGTLLANTKKLVVNGTYSQGNSGTLSESGSNTITISKAAKLNGKLRVTGKQLKANHYLIKAPKISGKFDHVSIVGGKHWTIDYTKHGVKVVKR